ncbi:neurotrophin 1 [Culicoides brevitarsis]|uniref:neurotrophin 1 n=1 Tax=Culicoides brevitarsis TaxID=469753 RepID=UPI00307B4D6B
MKSNLLFVIFISFATTAIFASQYDDNDDELPDFEFDDGGSNSRITTEDDYLGDGDEFAEQLMAVQQQNQTSAAFAHRERKIRQVLIRALANTKLRQKFVEVMPVLRMMTKAQRLTLAALIQAQVDGNRVLTLEQVKQLFGNREDLILPLVLDIANLIKMAAESAYLSQQRKKIQEFEQPSQMQLLRRSFFTLPRPEGFHRRVDSTKKDVPVAPNDEEETQATVTDITKFVVANLKDDRMHLDDKDLEAIVKNVSHDRNKREKEMFPQALPLKMTSEAEDHIQKKLQMTYHERKMNMTSFNATKQHQDQTAMASDGGFVSFLLPETNMTMDEIEDLTFEAVGTTTMDPNSSENSTDFENLPQPEQLVRVVRPKIIQNKRILVTGKQQQQQRPLARKQTLAPAPLEEICEKFSSTVCLQVKNYPMEQVMRSIKRHKTAMHALLADFKDKSDHLGPEEYFDQFYGSNRRQDDGAKGAMCESIIKFARPQKARSATGEWKYIVNTGSHTQTLRLEKCTAPLDSCSYLTDNYRSRCIQVYNYHRLLSWDVSRGLHVDIFKVPTCCSCHIDGYKEIFPPILPDYTKDPYETHFELDDDSHLQSAAPSNIQYSTLKDLETNSADEDDIANQYTDGFKRKMKPLKNNHQLAAKQPIRSAFDHIAVTPSNSIPILDEFLSPPVSSYDPTIQFKNRLPITGRRRPGQPLRKQANDQTSASSDYRTNEVTVLPPSSVVTQNIFRKRVTPSLAATVNTTTNIKLLKAQQDAAKRVNYNYHPIIDFFEQENNKQHQNRQGQVVDRIGNVERNNAWRPVVANNNFNRRGGHGGIIRGI